MPTRRHNLGVAEKLGVPKEGSHPISFKGKYACSFAVRPARPGPTRPGPTHLDGCAWPSIAPQSDNLKELAECLQFTSTYCTPWLLFQGCCIPSCTCTQSHARCECSS